jgi:hypothetical protein
MCALHMAPMAPSMPQKEASIDRVHTYGRSAHPWQHATGSSRGVAAAAAVVQAALPQDISVAGAKHSHRR